MAYRPLRGVKVLDLGILIPPALTTAKLAALGADVVKVELPGSGDRARHIPPLGPDGQSPQFTAQARGKRSIALDLRTDEGRATFLELAAVADVIVENQLAGAWQRMGVDLAALRGERPALIICSITGFGQTGPWADLPSHGLNMDALAYTLNVVETPDGPRIGWSFTSWGNELGATYAALAVSAALLEARATGEGAWIDLSCWDALVESHRTELAMMVRTGERFNLHDSDTGVLYNIYTASDGRPVMLAALEPKFWRRFCEHVGRADLLDRNDHAGGEIEFGWGAEGLRAELAGIFATATAAEWDARFRAWDVPGSLVLQVDDVIRTEHYAARGITEGVAGEWPNVTSAIRWHHVDERAGAGLGPPPALDGDRAAILAEWLGT